MCLCVRYMEVPTEARKVLGAPPPKMQLQEAVSCLKWALGTELRSHGRAAKCFTPEPPLQPWRRDLRKWFKWGPQGGPYSPIHILAKRKSGLQILHTGTKPQEKPNLPTLWPWTFSPHNQQVSRKQAIYSVYWLSGPSKLMHTEREYARFVLFLSFLFSPSGLTEKIRFQQRPEEEKKSARGYLGEEHSGEGGRHNSGSPELEGCQWGLRLKH